MNRQDLFKILSELDIEVVHVNHRGWAVCRCPFAEFLHERGTDYNPSFNVRIDPNGPSGFNCFTCKTHGRISTLINKLGYYRDENYNHLALRAEVCEIPEAFPAFEAEDEAAYVPAAINPHIYLAMYPLAWECKDSRAYLMRRKIGEATSHTLQLRYDPERCRILFPVFDYKHDLYGFTGRSIIPDDKRDPRSPKIKNYAGLRKEYRLLGEHLIDRDKPLLVVEGLFGLAHVIEQRVRKVCNPVAIMGSDMSDAQRDLLLSHDQPVFLLFDNDAAGSVGLFGEWDPVAGTHLGGGAIDKLKQHTPTFECLYPERTDEIDDLTGPEIERMLAHDHVVH